MHVVIGVYRGRCVFISAAACLDKDLLRIAVTGSYARRLLWSAIHADNAPRGLKREHDEQKEEKQFFHYVKDCTGYKLSPQIPCQCGGGFPKEPVLQNPLSPLFIRVAGGHYY